MNASRNVNFILNYILIVNVILLKQLLAFVFTKNLITLFKLNPKSKLCLFEIIKMAFKCAFLLYLIVLN